MSRKQTPEERLRSFVEKTVNNKRSSSLSETPAVSYKRNLKRLEPLFFDASLAPALRVEAFTALTQDAIHSTQSYKYLGVTDMALHINKTRFFFMNFTASEKASYIGTVLGLARSPLSSEKEEKQALSLLSSVQDDLFKRYPSLSAKYNIIVAETMFDMFPLLSPENKKTLYAKQHKLLEAYVQDQSIATEDVHRLTYRLAQQEDVDEVLTVNNRVHHIMAYAVSRDRKDDKIFAQTWKNGLKHYPDIDNWKKAFVHAYQRTYRIDG